MLYIMGMGLGRVVLAPPERRELKRDAPVRKLWKCISLIRGEMLLDSGPMELPVSCGLFVGAVER
jgi:hypothetical protein